MEYQGILQLELTRGHKTDLPKFFTQVNKILSESKTIKDQMEEQAQKNFRWWKNGTQEIDWDMFHPTKSVSIDNRIFTNIESILPIWTANTPEATVMKVENTVREKIQAALQEAYEVDQKMNNVLQRMLRNWMIDRIGILKYRWNKDKLDNGFTTEVVLAKKVGFDRYAKSLETCDYIWEEMEKSPKELVSIFGHEEELKRFYPELKGKAKYYEIWAGRGAFVVWVIPEHQLLLDAMENPNFNYEEKQKTTDILAQTSTPPRNIFQRPKFPYFVFNLFNRSDENGLYDDTSIIEQASVLQKQVNLLERQISDLIEGQKRVWAISADAMSQEKSQNLVNKTGDLVVYYDRGTPQGGIELPISGKPDASYYTYLEHLLLEIDNVMGVHSVSRGEPDMGKKETLGAQRMKLTGDTSRSDMVVRNIEAIIEDWYLAFLQMHLVYSINGLVFDGKNGKEKLSRDEIPTDVKIMVKKGTTLPSDDKSRMDMAIMLAKAGMIDPQTLFEELGYGNEDKRVQDLFKWLQMTGKIQPQPPQQPQGQPPMNAPQQGQPQQTQGTSNPLDQISQILSSPDFHKLPPQEQQKIIERIKTLLSAVQTVPAVSTAGQAQSTQ